MPRKVNVANDGLALKSRLLRFCYGAIPVALAARFLLVGSGLTGCALDTINRPSMHSVDWPTYGNDYGNRRYSSLTSINVDTVAHLVPSYVIQTGVIGSFEGAPIVVNKKLYFSTASDGVVAADAATGEILWKRAPITRTGRLCCGPVNRGVAVGSGVVAIGQLDAKLVALDARSGKQKWSVMVADPSAGYSITMAPIIYRNSVIVGVAGGEFGIRGFLASYAVDSGKLRWRWHSTDAIRWKHFSARGDDRPQRDLILERKTYSRFSNAWKRGGGAIWSTPALDVDRKMLILSTGNPWPDGDGSVRPGDNLFTDCIVALSVTDGALLWYYQETAHDVHDADAASPPVLLETVEGSRTVAAVAEASKTGWLYILDRATGRLIRRSQNVGSLAATKSAAAGRIFGGVNWSPISIDPSLHLAILSGRHLTARQARGESDESDDSMHPVAREDERYGLLSAVDINDGHIVWQDQFDLSLVGGSVSTAGGLTFFGEPFGDFDAVETKTGKVLWRFQTGAGVNAPPVVFAIDGIEYVAVASGGNRQIDSPYGDALFVFRLATPYKT